MNLPEFTYLHANFLQHLTEKKLLPCLFRLSLYNRAVFRAITRLWIIALK